MNNVSDIATTKPPKTAPALEIFRFREAPELNEAAIMSMGDYSPEVAAAVTSCVDAGLSDGADTRVIFHGFGLSIVHVWFKRSFPLPLHTHDSDCFYYIIAGGLRIGTEELGPGDGFLIPAEMPYTYRAGEHGVELIEIRNRETFEYRERSTTAFWTKATEVVKNNRQAWINARRPSSIGT